MKFSIFTKLAYPVTSRVITITFEGQLNISDALSPPEPCERYSYWNRIWGISYIRVKIAKLYYLLYLWGVFDYLRKLL